MLTNVTYLCISTSTTLCSEMQLPGYWHTPPSMRFEFYTELVTKGHQMRIRTSTHVWQIRNTFLCKSDEKLLFLLISCTTRTSCFGCLIACHCFNFVFNPFASQFSFHFLPYTAHTIFTTLYIRYSLQWWISIFIIKLVFIMFKGKDTRLCHLRQSIKCCH